MINLSDGVFVTGAIFFLLSSLFIFVSFWQRRNGVPETREARLEAEVADLRKEVAKLQAAVQTLTDAWTVDRQKLTHVMALNRDLQEQMAALTGKSGAGPVAAKTLTMLRKALIERLRLEELNVLAADVEVDLEDIGGETQEAKALKLLQYLQDRNKVGNLIYALRRMRPDITLDVQP